MPAFHSSYIEGNYSLIASIPILPIRSKFRGPAMALMDVAAEDIIDEAIALFRANCFFRNFEIKGPADRVLVYLILYISECITKLSQKSPTQVEATKLLQTHAVSSFAIPGDPSFPLGALYEKPTSRDIETYRQYLQQLRQETSTRLIAKIYDPAITQGDKPSKWWMCFAKRKFMNLSNVSGLAF
ncbi:actin-related protein 2/3 complex subunit 3 [Cladochytrium replicatum]|nr:actin-related protein 2/3 complex subunit 3 [Cladochytrium replicatum]